MFFAETEEKKPNILKPITVCYLSANALNKVIF